MRFVALLIFGVALSSPAQAFKVKDLETFKSTNSCVKCDLRRAELKGGSFKGANLSKAKLRDVDFKGADLSGANLSGAQLRRADMEKSNLVGSNLKGADLIAADMEKSNLQGRTSAALMPGTPIWTM